MKSSVVGPDMVSVIKVVDLFRLLLPVKNVFGRWNVTLEQHDEGSLCVKLELS